MIVIKNKLIPFGSYTTINLFGIVFTKVEMTERLKNHERIHTYQMLEVGAVVALFITALILIADISAWWLLLACPTYYVMYCLEYIRLSVFHSKQHCIYKDISFEEEAYNNDENLNYIAERKLFAWTKYLDRMSNHTDNKNCCK